MMKKAFALIAGLAWTGLSAAATYELVETVETAPIDSWAAAVAVGDVTGDGLDDVVVATEYSQDQQKDYQLLVYSQNPSGNLGEAYRLTYSDWSLGVDVKIGDLDNDEIQDVVVGHYRALTVLRSDGAGGFRHRKIDLPVGSNTTNIQLFDVNSDGNLDIIVQYWYEGTIILYGDGHGYIAAEQQFAVDARGYNDLAIEDVTADGRPDLVVVSATSNRIYVYPHDGIDGFGGALSFVPPANAWSPTAVAVGDFNNDNWNDIAINAEDDRAEAGLWLYPGSSTGILDAPLRLATSDVPSALIGADLDRDSRTDLLVGHKDENAGAVGRYMQGASGLGAEVLTATVFKHDARTLAVGDVNDDGCTDVAIAGRDRGLIILQGRHCTPVNAVNDFNGDGRSDLFWHHAGTGANVIWSGADYREQQPVVRVANPSWQVKGHGDFDGDGRADVLWRNVATGAGAIWRSGDFATQQAVTRVSNLDWTIAGIGDFDGDGKDDLLWRNYRSGQNAIWKAGNYHDQQVITAVTDPRWTVVAVDDFDGDRKDDILWRNAVSGGNAIWQSGNYRTQQPVTGVSNQAWQVAGTGDFDGDDRADVLWRNERTGVAAIWNAADIDDQSLVGDMGLEWVVAAVGDHDGNRNAEVVWRNRVTGENRIWRAMNAALELPVVDVESLSWQVVH